jgi:hypothetical protein
MGDIERIARFGEEIALPSARSSALRRNCR